MTYWKIMVFNETLFFSSGDTKWAASHMPVKSEKCNESFVRNP